MTTKLHHRIIVNKYGLTETNQLELWYERNGLPFYSVLPPCLLDNHIQAKHHSGGVSLFDDADIIVLLSIEDEYHREHVALEIQELLNKMLPADTEAAFMESFGSLPTYCTVEFYEAIERPAGPNLYDHCLSVRDRTNRQYL